MNTFVKSILATVVLVPVTFVVVVGAGLKTGILEPIETVKEITPRDCYMHRENTFWLQWDMQRNHKTPRAQYEAKHYDDPRALRTIKLWFEHTLPSLEYPDELRNNRNFAEKIADNVFKDCMKVADGIYANDIY